MLDKWNYTCNNKSFNNKWQAINEAGTTGGIQFNAPSVYEQYDFTKEPTETWNELLSNKARAIRDSYDYLRIWYCKNFVCIQAAANVPKKAMA